MSDDIASFTSLPATPAAPMEHPVPLVDFAATLRPRSQPLLRNGAPVMQNQRPVMEVAAGHPDEIWLKMLKIQHGTERHTMAGWSALIDRYRHAPAHPTVLGT